jgi:hypothetical protein
MKNGLWIILMVLVLATSCSAYASSPQAGYYPDMSGQYGGDPQQYGQQPYDQQQYGMDMDTNSMYNYLAPYGNWVDMPPYGYVWTPRNMGYQWRPYSNGHWVMTEYGWTWIAYEPWGAVPFHYGRWGYDDYIGWYWVPGNTWGPAWVSWRWNDQYAGWAPLQPGIEIRANMDFGSISINIPIRSWNFLQILHFLDTDVNRYTLPYERNSSLYNYTNNRNNINFRNDRLYNEGINVDVVRRLTRRNVAQYRIQDAKRPGRARIAGKDLQIYRPNLRLTGEAKPKAFLNTEDARRELAPVKVFEPKPQAPLNAQTGEVRRRQAEEKALLERTQAEDLRIMKRNRDLELAKVRDNAEKEKIKLDRQNQIIELQKQQQGEKVQLIERHKKDTEVVQEVTKKVRLKRQATTVKKKKGGKN